MIGRKLDGKPTQQPTEQKIFTTISLGGLWEHQDKNGDTYLSGPLNGYITINIFPNKFKKGKAPDYYVSLTSAKNKPNPIGPDDIDGYDD
ncbi:MAG: hypothetical protein WC975_13315 [Phycisphaerae bacterium]